MCITSLFSCLSPILTSLRFALVHLSLSSDLNGFDCLKIILKHTEDLSPLVLHFLVLWKAYFSGRLPATFSFAETHLISMSSKYLKVAFCSFNLVIGAFLKYYLGHL